MEAQILIQGKKDLPVLGHLGKPFIDATRTEKITFVLIEGGMRSGEPSVMIVSETNHGPVILQTSLDKFLMAASGMATAAESRWGWTRPEGHATIMPPDKKTRKSLLEKIKQELEEWDDVDGTDETPEGRNSPS